MQILRRHLREPLVDLLLREAIGGQHGRDLLVGRDIADDGQIGLTGVEALIRGGLRRNGTGERGDRREGTRRTTMREDGFRQVWTRTNLLLITRRPGRQRAGRWLRQVPWQHDACLTSGEGVGSRA